MATALALSLPATVVGQEVGESRAEVRLYGVRLRAEPVKQFVPKDIATIVSTYFQTATLPDGSVPAIPEGAEMRATLRGPSLEQPRELTARPNSPFHIPPLTIAGTHTLDNIRLVKGDDVLMYAEPESVVIEVIDRLLVTQVTARALTAAEIREKGLVFDSSSFQAYNFTAAFAAANGEQIRIDFPVVLPTLASVQDPRVSGATLPSIKPPNLKSIQTIIPDTLEIQAQVPNLSVTGFILTYTPEKDQNFIVPPIPGVVIIPGDIGFLNQVFSVLLMVGNVAPDGSNLVVSDATAEIVLPPGNDGVVLTPDDPLKIGRTAYRETPRIQPIAQAGPDGKLGTADDIGTIGPGESGNAEFLVEGIREGSHIVEMEIAATLNGLPVGPVPVRGRAAGAVLVRNPSFTLTFTHPEIVNAGEPYELDVTVTNTSGSPANFVSLNLNARNIVGATLAGPGGQEIETILPGDSATLTYNLVALVTGRITAATLDSDGKVAGRFELKTAVGELGIPLSPDSLILPREANALPPDLRKAIIGLLGRAYSVATAPPSALPADVRRFSRKVVWDRAVEAAEAGLRITLHEPIPDSAAHLWMDFAGSNFARLHERVAKEANLPFEREDYVGFDELRRRSFRGDVLADAVAGLLVEPFLQRGAFAFHEQLAEKMFYHPGHISVLLAAGGAPVPATLTLRDAAGRRLGGAPVQDRIAKEIPFSDFLAIRDAQGAVIAFIGLIAVPESGPFTIRLDRFAGSPTPLTLSIVTPDGNGNLRHYGFDNVASQVPQATFGSQNPHPFTVEMAVAGVPQAGAALAPTRTGAVADHAPSLMGAVQRQDADPLTCSDGSVVGLGARVIAVLFSEEVTPESVQHLVSAGEITSFLPEGNRVVSVALQPGRRIALLALRDPVGPFVQRSLTAVDVHDRSGQPMSPQTVPIEHTPGEPGGVVSGRVLQADGTPVPFANIRLIYMYSCEGRTVPFGISSKSTDADGAYSWDYVSSNPATTKVAAVDPVTDQPRSVSFKVQRNGQRMNVDLVFLGRGSLSGRTLRPDGRTPLAGTVVRARSLTDSSEYGAITDDHGRFTLLDVPVGNVLLQAVNVAAQLEGLVSEFIPYAGGSITRDFVLFPVGDGATIQRGTLRGHVLRSDGVTTVPGAPVVLYYQNRSQPGLACPRGAEGEMPECPVAASETATDGSFEFIKAYAGSHRVYAFDQATLEDGNALASLTANGISSATVLLSGGLGAVRGTVLDAAGAPVPGARVGGGFSIVTADQSGGFLLPDVPVGRRTITAVSDALRTTGTAVVDIPFAGAEVAATVVLQPIASVAGTVTDVDAVPVPGNRVYLFEKLRPAKEGDPPRINVIAQTTTNQAGSYLFERIPTSERGRQLFVSAFRSDFSDGNVVPVTLRYQDQLFRADIVFKGGGRGRVVGRVFDDDGVTPLPARVAISGEQPIVAGGLVGVGFQHVENFRIVDTDFTTGQFSLSGVWAGRFVLRAVGQFSPDPVSAEATMPPGAATVELNLRLAPTGRITGTVLQPDGVTPAEPGIIVRYKSDAFKVICSENALGEVDCVSIPQGIQNEQVVTGADGRYVLPLVNAGPFTITAEDPVTGRVARVKGEMKPGQSPDIPIRLLGLGSLTIQVIGSDAQTAIPDAEVVVRQVGFPDREVTVRTDAQGIVLLTGGNAFSEGEVIVLATDLRNGFAGRATGRITRDGENVTVPVFLYDAWGVVSGTVFAPDGLTPIPHAEVILSNVVGPLAFAVTGPDGAYRIEQIPLGGFTLDSFHAATGRRGFGSGQVDLNGQEVPVNIVQLGIGLVRGHVLRTGDLEPLVNWQVSLSQSSPTGRPLDTLVTSSGLDGEYSFPGVSVGSVQVSASNAEEQGSGSTASTLARDGQILDLPIIVKVARPLFGRIVGVVLNADLTPVPQSTIEVTTGSLRLFATADATGAFAIDQVPLGRFTLIAKSQTTPNVGGAVGEIAFEDEVDVLQVVLVGLSQIGGTVYRATGQVAANVAVSLDGDPASGCFIACTLGEEGCPVDGRKPSICSAFTDAGGRFSFANVPARTFSVIARDPVSSLAGMIGGRLTPGQSVDLRVVLEPSAVVTGRVLLASGAPAAGAAVEMLLPPLGESDTARGFYTRAGPDGSFRLELPLDSYSLTATDPLGSGMARRFGTLAGNASLGDIGLDEAAPSVTAVLPLPGAVQVARNAAVRLTFSEPILPGTVTPETVRVSSGSGPVTGVLQVSDNDTVVTFTPVSLLSDQTRYTVLVSGVEDRIGKAMAGSFTASFTTVDITPPSVIDITPIPNANGVTIYTTVRIKYSEPINPSKYRGPPIVLSTNGASVPGRIDYLFGNTVVVFTPARPLEEDRVYTVQLEQAFDLSGLGELQPGSFSFSTTDRTPPQLTGLVASNGGKVITNSFVTITADVGTSHDVALVDFFVNGTFASTARMAPFTLRLQAVTVLGTPGDHIQIQAFGVDTSGNRSTAPVTTQVLILADAAPGVIIEAPADGTAVRNGDRVEVTVRAVDDLGVVRLGYRAATGRPQDADSRTYDSPALAQSQVFAFTVPSDAVPGTTILIEATAIDTKGEQSSAIPISITVLDSVSPTISITGVSTGERVLPGQQATAVVSAADLGLIRSISFVASGIVSYTETRTIDPARSPVLASFTFTVPATARPGDSVRLDATATDRAGNTAAAAQVILPVADSVAPTVTLRTESGSLFLAPGQTITVIADADDEIAVSSVQLTGSGAFALSDARQVTPPAGSASVPFTITAPPTATPGALLTLTARSTDTSGNSSAPATLVLTIRSVNDLTLPTSALLLAGETQLVEMSVPGGAPEGGLRVDLSTSAALVATVPAFVTFVAGETTKTFALTGVSGGAATITASVQGVPRAQLIATVRGGIVSGVVLSPSLEPVSGVQVTVASGVERFATATGSDGRYFVEGASQPAITVRVLDPQTNLRGFAAGELNRTNGFVTLDVILVPAGTISGIVRRADGETPAGTGARVDLFDLTAPDEPVATVFTNDQGEYDFPLVPVGSYRLDAMDLTGNAGRSHATVTASGQALHVPIRYLGRGVVTGVVLDGFDRPVPNAALRFVSRSIFGEAPVVVSNAGLDGLFEFAGAIAGEFTITGRDDATDQAGTVSGELRIDGEIVSVVLRVSSWGALAGVVARQDGLTPVAGATVRSHGHTTTTDAEGRYELTLLPLGPYTLSVSDPGTRGLGYATGVLAAHGVTETVDVQLFDQGSLLVTVTTAAGEPVPGAILSVDARNGIVSDSIASKTGDDGTALVQRVLTGAFEVTAQALGLAGAAAGTLTANAVQPVTVVLEATGSIAGTIYLPDGQNPVTSGTVEVLDVHYPVDTDGTYRIDGLRLSTYRVSAYDPQGRLRARREEVALSGGGETTQVDLTFVALGTIVGRVVTPEGASASSLLVQVRSDHPLSGRHVQALTNAAGFYELADVPAGPFVVTTADPVRGLLGEGAGSVTVDGETVTVDILLVGNAITLPVTRHDANNFSYAVQPHGGTESSTATLGRLALVIGGGAHEFTGSAVGTVENQGREVAARQQNLGGLNVVRKTFVPLAGYFSRHLEIISNPTGAPIVADLRVTSSLSARSAGVPGVVTTSSGDAVLSADGSTADRWVVIDDGTDSDPFLTPTYGGFTFLFDGAGAADRADSVLFSSVGEAVLSYEWTSVVVPPGGTVAVMHFRSPQVSRGGAAAAAARLAQLPPEALAGLSPQEVAWIRNFAIPEGGVSGLAPLPALTGTVTGLALAGDGTTLLPGTSVSFTTALPVYGRTWVTPSDSTARFTLTGRLQDGDSIPVPLAPFSLQGVHPVTGVLGVAAGSFPPGDNISDTNLVFSGTTALTGVVRRHTGEPVTAGSVRLVGGTPAVDLSRALTTTGTFQFTGVPGGTFELTATVPHPQGSALAGAASFELVAGATLALDVHLAATGALSGTVTTPTGTPAAGAQVTLTAVGLLYATETDGSGTYLFAGVPAGQYEVRAASGAQTVTSNVEVAQDVTTTRDLGFAGVPSILSLTPAAGQQGQTLQVSVAAQFTGFAQGVTTADFGTGVTVGSVTVSGPTLATVTITVAPTASLGARTVTFTTGSEVVQAQNGFTVQAGAASVALLDPNQGRQGQTLTVNITGSNTHFVQGTTVASFGSGITVNALTVQTQTSATASVSIAAGATLGFRTVTVTTGGETASAVNGFAVEPGQPALTSVNPPMGRQAETLTLSVTGQFTHFEQGVTAASLGDGIAVNSLVVGSHTTATVDVTIDPAALPGSRTVTLTTGSEVATVVGGFTVLAGVPTLLSINPVIGEQGQSLTVVLTGQFTNFAQGVTTASFGPGITVGMVTVNGPTLASVPITVNTGATPGVRTVTVSTAGENVSLTGGFTVLPGTPALTVIDPNTGRTDQNLTVNVAAQFTSFQQGVTTASFGPNISVGGAAEGAPGTVTVTSATTFTANLAISAAAPLGPRNVTVQTESQTLTALEGFTVTTVDTTPPGVLSTSPANGATGVPLNTQIVVQFNEPIDRSTVTTSSFGLQDGATSQLVPGTVSVDVTGRVATFVPSRLLGVSRSHTVWLSYSSSIKDTSANALTFTGRSFTTGFDTSTAGPTLTMSSPSHGDTGVPVNARIVLQFTTPLNPVSRAAGLQVMTGGLAVPGTYTFSDSNRRVTFQPSSELLPDGAHTVALAAQLLDSAGNGLTNPGTISFQTGPLSDSTSPAIVSATPASGAVGVGVNAVVRVVFSERVNPLTVLDNFRLVHNATGQVQAASVAMAADRLSATLTPAAPLLAGTTYGFQLFSYADLAGRVGSGVNQSFTTAGGADTTPPTVRAIAPADGAAGVPVNARVVVRLSEPVDATSVGAATITLTPAVAGTVALSTDRQTVTFTPGAHLPVSTMFTVAVPGVRDAAGNLMAPFSSTFTTSGVATADTTAPTVVSSVPAHSATNVAVTTTITVAVSEPITAGAVDASSMPVFAVIGGSSIQIAGVYTVQAMGTEIVFTPSAALPGSTQIWTNINSTSTIKDLAGNNLTFSQRTFTTAAAVDATAPMVTSMTPVDGAVHVGLNTTVVLTFSKPLHPNTVNSATFGLFSGSTWLSTGVTRSADNQTVMLSATLPANAEIAVVATSDVLDLSGNPLADFVSRFTTGPAVDTSTAQVVTQRPGSGATGVAATSAVTLYVDKPLNAATVPGALYVSQDGILVAGTTTVTGGGTVITFRPAAPFVAGALVQVFLAQTARDQAGNAVSPFQGQFTVAPDRTMTAPTLVGTWPSMWSTGNLRNGIVDLEFSERLNSSTVTDATVSVLLNGSQPVAGTLSLREDDRIVRFVPAAPLEANTYYYVTVTGGVQDREGAPFADTWFYFHVADALDTEAPVVIGVTPPEGATGVGVNAPIRVTFSEAVNPLTVSGATVRVSGGSLAAVPASISFGASNTEVTITPLVALPDMTLMTIRVEGVEDGGGNTVTLVTTTFMTRTGADTTAPTVMGMNVFSGQTNVPVNTVLQVQFNEPMDPLSITPQTIALIDHTMGTLVAGAVSLSPDGRTASLAPTSALAVGRTYTLYAHYSCCGRDLAGNALSGTSSSFTTSVDADTTSPVVLFTNPGSGSASTPTNSRLQVLFDEPIDPLSLERVTLELAGQVAAVTHVVSNSNRTVTLTPAALLAPNSSYTLRISGVRDTSGTVMQVPVDIEFTTGSGVDFTRPSVQSISPAHGSTGVPLSTVVEVVFSEAVNPLSAIGAVALRLTNTGAIVPTKISFSSDFRTVILTPVLPLSPGTQYSVVTSFSVTDRAGNQTTNAVTATFTTQ